MFKVCLKTDNSAYSIKIGFKVEKLSFVSLRKTEYKWALHYCAAVHDKWTTLEEENILT